MASEATIVNPKTNQVWKVNLTGEEIKKLEDLNQTAVPEDFIMRGINNLKISAEAKAILAEIYGQSIKIGQTVVFIGIKVIEYVFYFLKKYPQTAIGVVIGAVIGMLVNSVPLVGWVFGAFITPLCVALGLAFGFWSDLKNDMLKREIDARINENFGQFKNAQFVS